MTTTRCSHNNNHNNNTSRKPSMMRRRTLQVVAAAALVVSSANAFATPQSATRSMMVAHSSPLTMTDQAAATEKQAFELEVGKALDTLRTDYPDMLRKRPNYSIYDSDIVVVDPSGFKLNGITNYKQAFKLVHSILNVFYCPEKSLLTNRIVWDCTRNNIRVSWNAEVVPKAIFGGTKTTLHVDGISVYVLNNEGKVTQHRVEHLMINDTPVETERGIFHALQNSECDHPDCSIPVFYKDEVFTVPFTNPVTTSIGGKTSMLFEEEDSTTTSSLNSVSASSSNNNNNNNDKYPGLDWEALERKNASRKKFGLDPISPEEFLEIEAQVQQMEVQQAPPQGNADATNVPASEKKKNNMFSNLFGEVFEDSCESNFDCQRPEICCDFGFKKMCCSSGAMVGMERQPVRIPITKDDGYNKGW